MNNNQKNALNDMKDRIDAHRYDIAFWKGP